MAPLQPRASDPSPTPPFSSSRPQQETRPRQHTPFSSPSYQGSPRVVWCGVCQSPKKPPVASPLPASHSTRHPSTTPKNTAPLPAQAPCDGAVTELSSIEAHPENSRTAPEKGT
ncbi:hypothetical protein B0H67DRAFT_330960 [Lasiosphaeris hirsuta]|uniref:Uncharacterized protein n=1 Tax=Lasiosphaeris hirsuta TaxID=260670 RepID=A0AA40A2N6_9PEZI|nr:hypothetical protein B0H67DRAFT_330960 [Lasiosphaeris hirsuta]